MSVRKDQKEVGNVTCFIVAVLSPVKNFIVFYQESTLLQAQNVYVDVLMPGDAILPLHRKIAWRATSCGRLITVSLHLKFITTVFIFAFATLKFSRGYHELFNAPPKGGVVFDAYLTVRVVTGALENCHAGLDAKHFLTKKAFLSNIQTQSAINDNKTLFNHSMECTLLICVNKFNIWLGKTIIVLNKSAVPSMGRVNY